MTSEAVVILLSGIAASGTFLSGVADWLQVRRDRKLVQKTDAMVQKTEEIHVMVNSHADEQQKKLDAALAKIDELQQKTFAQIADQMTSAVATLQLAAEKELDRRKAPRINPERGPR